MSRLKRSSVCGQGQSVESKSACSTCSYVHSEVERDAHTRRWSSILNVNVAYRLGMNVLGTSTDAAQR